MKEKRIWCIYMHKNTINGKVYIGQTCQQPQKRWGNGLSQYRHNKYFYSAIEKYGWENFNHIILINNLKTAEEANFWQDYFINFYDSRNRQKGYNLMKGGQTSPFVELWKNKEFKQKQSKRQSIFMKQRMRDPKNKEFLKQQSKLYWENNIEAKKKQSQVMSNRAKELWKNEKYREAQSQRFKQYLRTHKEEQKIHSRNNALKNWQNKEYREKICKKVKNIETGLIFESAAAAARWCGLADRSSITKHLTQHTKSAGKHPDLKIPLHWEYFNKEEVI